LSLASVRATSTRRRHVPGPAFPVARSGVRIWRAEPIYAGNGRAALLERGVAAVDRPVQAGAVICAPTAVSISTRGGRGQGQNNEGDQNEWDRAHDCLLDRSTPDPIFALADFAFSENIYSLTRRCRVLERSRNLVPDQSTTSFDPSLPLTEQQLRIAAAFA